MSALDELKRTIRRNKLLGLWAAGKLGLVDAEAETYSDALAVGTLDAEQGDVFGKIRKDFDAAGVAQSDDQILAVMNELLLQTGGQTQGDCSNAAALAIVRNLTSRSGTS